MLQRTRLEVQQVARSRPPASCSAFHVKGPATMEAQTQAMAAWMARLMAAVRGCQAACSL
jgi:hypothetical protein